MDQVQSSLVRAAKSGSPEALDRLFAACGGRLLGLIRMRLGGKLRARLESRDILQSTMLKAFEGLDGLESDNSHSLMAWLTRIAENEIRDQAAFHGRQRRDAQRDVPIDQAPAEAVAEHVRSLSSRLVLAEQTTRIEIAIDELEADHREAVLLRYYHEMSFKEVGVRMGRSADAARMLLARAMAALTVRLGDTR